MKKDYNYLKNFSLFDKLNQIEVEKFIKLMKFDKIKEGDILIKEGDHGDSIILLLSGKVSITQALTLKNKNAISDNREKMLTRLDADKFPFFGEISLFNEVDKRTATITAISDCEIATIDDDDILKLCDEPMVEWLDQKYNFESL